MRPLLQHVRLPVGRKPLRLRLAQHRRAARVAAAAARLQPRRACIYSMSRRAAHALPYALRSLLRKNKREEKNTKKSQDPPKTR